MGGPGSGSKPKVYDPLLIEEVRRLYFDEVMSSAEVAEIFGVRQPTIIKWLHKWGFKPRPTVKRNQTGEFNDSWKGDKATYAAFHIRVSQTRGKPKHCERCGKTDPEIRYEWANLTGQYSDITDYERMCVSCHRRFDAARQTSTGQRTSPVRGRKEVVPNA